MNHSFKANIGSEHCALCGFNEVAHSDNATCEGCPTVGPCEVFNGMLLCANCFVHDKELEAEQSEIPSNDRATRIAQLTNKLAKEIPADRRMYFVGRLTAIVDVERDLIASGIENPNYALAEIIEQNLLRLKDVLRNKHEEIRELQASSVADQKYLNQIVPQLRENEREKFKQYDINYKPNEVVKAVSTVSKPRMSASDKAVESMAKMLGISVEQARISLNSATKNVLNVQCTCAVTPGMCKVHVS